MTMKLYTSVWVVFVLSCLAAALALGCGEVDARGLAELDAGGAAGLGGHGGAAGGAGVLEVGGAGGAGGELGQAGAGGAGGDIDAGPHVGASTAPACRGAFVGAPTQCPRVTTPTGSLQCEVGCSSLASDNAAGCLSSGVTYCVTSCARCVW